MFQQKLDECFGHKKNLIVIADDIMVVGKKHNHKDHDLAFTILLQMARKCKVKLNHKKNYNTSAQKSTSMEKQYTTDGHKPAQSKITATVEMPSPGSKKEVHSFIGMINYLSKFSPRLTRTGLSPLESK